MFSDCDYDLKDNFLTKVSIVLMLIPGVDTLRITYLSHDKVKVLTWQNKKEKMVTILISIGCWKISSSGGHEKKSKRERNAPYFDIL